MLIFCFLSADSTNSSENIYTMMNPIGPGGNRPNVSPGNFYSYSTSFLYALLYHVKNTKKTNAFLNYYFNKNCFSSVPNGTRSGWTNGRNGSNGAASYEWITRWDSCVQQIPLLRTFGMKHGFFFLLSLSAIAQRPLMADSGSAFLTVFICYWSKFKQIRPGWAGLLILWMWRDQWSQ